MQNTDTVNTKRLSVEEHRDARTVISLHNVVPSSVGHLIGRREGVVHPTIEIDIKLIAIQQAHAERVAIRLGPVTNKVLILLTRRALEPRLQDCVD